jgi:hypothetical protein
MKHLFVPYEIAFKLKEKGFDEPCIGYFNRYKKWNNYPFFTIDDGNLNNLPTPLYQQVIDWFREKHRIHIKIDIQDVQLDWYCYDVLVVKESAYMNDLLTDMNFKTYYEALDKAIEETLKLI